MATLLLHIHKVISVIPVLWIKRHYYILPGEIWSVLFFFFCVWFFVVFFCFVFFVLFCGVFWFCFGFFVCFSFSFFFFVGLFFVVFLILQMLLFKLIWMKKSSWIHQNIILIMWTCCNIASWKKSCNLKIAKKKILPWPLHLCFDYTQ